MSNPVSSSTASSNPLLQTHTLPPFSAVKPEHVEPAISELLNRNRERTNALLAEFAKSGETPTWETLNTPIDQWDDEVNQAFSPVGHLNSVMNSDALRDAYNACLPLLSQYSTEIGQNADLFKAYEAV